MTNNTAQVGWTRWTTGLVWNPIGMLWCLPFQALNLREELYLQAFLCLVRRQVTLCPAILLPGEDVSRPVSAKAHNKQWQEQETKLVGQIYLGCCEVTVLIGRDVGSSKLLVTLRWLAEPRRESLCHCPSSGSLAQLVHSVSAARVLTSLTLRVQ